MGILNIGTLALNANMVALQTIGNNIANANTVGYSRQVVNQTTVAGQYTGAGYIGKGVAIETIKRNYDQFLTRQSTLASSTQAGDVTRADNLTQLSNIFQGGTDGIGASINDMLNAFSDVASAPTDLTARTVALTRIDETARRMRAASQSLDDLQTGISQSLSEKISAVNTLAQNIADVNEQIARVQNNGQPPNDLLDKRDQLIKNLNQYVQTSSIPADDGTVGIYIGGSQALVLGTRPATLTLAKNDFGDPLQSKVVINRDGSSVTMDENTLGGGEVSGLLRFQNNDLVEGRNLLGRLTTAVTTSMNTQHALGLDLSGQPGGNLFTPVSVDTVLQPVAPAIVNTGGADVHVAIADVTQFVASDYQVDFSSATAGSITRKSDGKITAFDFATPPVTVDGLRLSNLGAGANPGDRFYLKPFSNAASNITREFSAASALAVASPIVGQMGSNNTGSLQLTSLATGVNPPANVPVTISFTSANSYTRSDVAGTFTYTSGQAILGGGTPNAWSLVLQGSPRNLDSFTVQNITATSLDPKLNGGNATALMNLRDVATFDGAAMTDGYASLIAQIGIRTQSANYSATVSSNIATTAEKDRAGVSGVNLDEEAAKLLQYQQAYQASAKMIQIAQSIFDTLIQTLGR
jgi:flagellar hook-associated protein 1 FlgK